MSLKIIFDKNNNSNYITGKASNWNQICSFILFQLINLFQFRANEFTITYVKVDLHAPNSKKFVN